MSLNAMALELSGRRRLPRHLWVARLHPSVDCSVDSETVPQRVGSSGGHPVQQATRGGAISSLERNVHRRSELYPGNFFPSRRMFARRSLAKRKSGNGYTMKRSLPSHAAGSINRLGSAIA